MEMTLYIAGLLGPVLLLAGLAGLMDPSRLEKADKEALKSPALMLLCGMAMVPLGILMVDNHNMWSWDMAGVVTLFGWIMLVKGALILAWPAGMTKLYNMMCSGNCTTFYRVASLVMLALGAWMSYAAWM